MVLNTKPTMKTEIPVQRMMKPPSDTLAKNAMEWPTSNYLTKQNEHSKYLPRPNLSPCPAPYARRRGTNRRRPENQQAISQDDFRYSRNAKKWHAH
jgi:hypothetical protein